MVYRDDARELLPLRRMAARLGVPAKWLKEQAEAGRVVGLKAGNRWLFDPYATSQDVRALARESAPKPNGELNENRGTSIMPTIDEGLPLPAWENKGGESC